MRRPVSLFVIATCAVVLVGSAKMPRPAADQARPEQSRQTVETVPVTTGVAPGVAPGAVPAETVQAAVWQYDTWQPWTRAYPPSRSRPLPYANPAYPRHYDDGRAVTRYRPYAQYRQYRQAQPWTDRTARSYRPRQRPWNEADRFSWSQPWYSRSRPSWYADAYRVDSPRMAVRPYGQWTR